MPSVRKQRGGRKPTKKPITVADSPALKRIIEEVRAADEKDRPWGGYNRTYHRHNR